MLINELLVNPAHGWDCANASIRNPWVELYNPKNQALDLYAAHAKFDNNSDAPQLLLPQGSTIAAHGFFIIFLPTSYNYTDNPLRFLMNDAVIDLVSGVPSLAPDQSYARVPDGSAQWKVVDQPTIAISNSTIIPTPTPSPRATRSITPTKQQTGKTGIKGSTSQTSKKLPVEGTQPAWAKLQVPESATPPSALEDDSTPTATNFASSPSGSDELGKKLVLSALAISLTVALFWCWKIFTRKGSRSEEGLAGEATDAAPPPT
ncbi:MAG: hypothetical protein J2P36_22470 [Ktedonobacteraceae bacterium]|nr:hypothetical protein [Ktedonobacteraceae bacterium]